MKQVTYPRSSLDSEPYWEGCRSGELRYQHCTSCGSVVFHPRALCPYCLHDTLEWKASAGRGRVYSYSVQHVPLRPDAGAYAPRVLGIAEVDEGFHMFAEFLADDPEQVAIGDPLEVVFVEVADDLVLPKFRVGAK
ncbi:MULTISPECIES: Zn-ribbon domain-containing OB-fold protein [Burkholderiaceae]|uniref:Zn-ribbon domain-containing OB-fold protein n=1 Tax=Burkholderiaceae TaxID=119060 RepID=UPI0003988967|nr:MULTISPECIES: Zn-ribbon domain-containing OB-fold protein [Burkholderiaceae]ERJ37732.1 Acetyl-CoA acetyltransferase [Burkholderia sp. AU4i]MBA9948843.1 Zn-ribbon domain-containing OB-fold protein [Burkholderia cepacia]MBA9979129.1 Zn-ribbon domain-containing OB-fold protein [Burkholderia cepacia]MBA9997813.1 Zn-ribbon domain-containing OB-fold protein [Burkholderia cepacia]MBB0005858.1 Zn-ribbon domain-containing OB-fold protein [Burkholderia cepacia]